MGKNIVIIGVGNYLMGDEGIGIHAVKYLDQFDFLEGVELIDAGVPGPSLLYMMEDRDLSIIIDCADFGGNPGDVITVSSDQIVKEGEDMISLHETSLLGTLALAESTGIKISEVKMILIQPKMIEMKQDLSDEVMMSLMKIKEEIQKLV